MLIRTQFSVVEHVHQKTKLFSGKCSHYVTPAALPRREDSKFHARAWVVRMTIWSAVKLIMLIRTQFSAVENVHQKNKLFSGNCLRYFTPAALPRREDSKFHARAWVFRMTIWSSVKLTMLVRTQFLVVENVHQKTKLFSWKCSHYVTSAALPRREDSKFHARAWVFRMTIWSAVKLIMLLRTQFSVVEHVHQKNI